MEGIMPLFIRFCDLRVRPWLGITTILAVDLFLEIFIDRCIHGIFSSEQKLSFGIRDPGDYFDEDGD